MQCPTCQKTLDDGLRFCPHDGTPLLETTTDGIPPPADATPTGNRVPGGPALALPATVGGRYEIEEMRGGGGMARVYRGTDLTLNREVAVKLINPDLRSEAEFDARFQREARIASQLADPHIVVVHDFGFDPVLGPFLVMEYLHGQSLRERIAQLGPLPLKAGLQLCAQLFLALIHAHGKGIVHRDIKPDNIFLLNQSGVRLHVRVLDFGIARIYRRDSDHESLTLNGAVLGTPRYMSPEQLAGQPVDMRSDIYSAALVIHEALTGRMPYVDGKRLTELCKDATPALQDLLDQCLKPFPDERPPTAVEVYLRLQELGKASGVLLLPPGAMDRLVAARNQSDPTLAYAPKKKPGRPWFLAGLLLVGLLAGLGGAAWWFLAPRGAALLGAQVGDPQAKVAEDLRLRKTRSGHPWLDAETRALLSPLLTADDLDLPDEELPNLETRWSADGQVVGVFHQARLRALVVRGRAAAVPGGVSIPTPVEGLPGSPLPGAVEREAKAPDGFPVRIYRSAGRGLAVEVKTGSAHAAALFPAVP